MVWFKKEEAEDHTQPVMRVLESKLRSSLFHSEYS